MKPWGSPAATLPRVGSPAIDTARAEVCNAAMKRVTAFAVLFVVLATPAWAGWNEAKAAYARGDYATEFREIKLLAEQGLASAQYNLGVMYDEGQGVPQDYVQAHMWFSLAAAGLPPGEDRNSAAEYRDIVAKLLTAAQIAEAQRLAREWKPK